MRWHILKEGRGGAKDEVGLSGRVLVEWQTEVYAVYDRQALRFFGVTAGEGGVIVRVQLLGTVRAQDLSRERLCVAGGTDLRQHLEVIGARFATTLPKALASYVLGRVSAGQTSKKSVAHWLQGHVGAVVFTKKLGAFVATNAYQTARSVGVGAGSRSLGTKPAVTGRAGAKGPKAVARDPKWAHVGTLAETAIPDLQWQKFATTDMVPFEYDESRRIICANENYAGLREEVNKSCARFSGSVQARRIIESAAETAWRTELYRCYVAACLSHEHDRDRGLLGAGTTLTAATARRVADYARPRCAPDVDRVLRSKIRS